MRAICKKAFGLAATVVTVAAVAAACSSETSSPMVSAYLAAHPTPIDSPLRPSSASEQTVLAEIRAILGPESEVWLPQYLPEGFSVAAPYNGDGSGSAYPNPYAVGESYSVAYTDGASYIILVCNPADDLTGGWEMLEESLDGRVLRMQRDTDSAMIATVEDGGPRLTVGGGGFPPERLESELIRVAVSLSKR